MKTKPPDQPWESVAEKILDKLEPDDRKIIVSFLDSRVTKAVNSFINNHPINDAELEKRLFAIEKAADKQIHDAMMDKILFQKCLTNNIDYDMVKTLGVTFVDENDIENKLSKVASTVKKNDEEAQNRKMNELLASGFKPKSGNDSTKIDVKKMSFDEAVYRESHGGLD